MDGYIELSHVKKSFIGRRNRTESLIRAVDDVSLSLKKCESIGIIGTSGCGKTTILKMIMGLLKPDE